MWDLQLEMFRRLHLYRWKPSSGHVYRVVALDGSTWTYELEVDIHANVFRDKCNRFYRVIQTRAKGTELLQLILRDLAIPDGDYFGLFQAENNRVCGFADSELICRYACIHLPRIGRVAMDHS